MTTNLSNKIRSNIFLDDFLKNIPIVNKTSEELLRVESIELLSQTSFTCLINLLMYWFDDYHIAFVCGKKYTPDLLKKEWKRLHDNSEIQILKELSIPYTKVLLENIKQQSPESISNFNDNYGNHQGKIFGYFVLCEEQFSGFGNNASHFFTNKNTWSFFSTKTPNISEKSIKFITDKIGKNKEKCINCVVGSTAVTLFGEKNIELEEYPEIWNPENNDIANIIDTIDSTRVKKLRIQNKKIEWFGEYYMVPSREIDLVENSVISSENFFWTEDIVGYYMGIKFLYVGGNTSNIKIKNYFSDNWKIPRYAKIYKPDKKHKITSVWEYKMNMGTTIHRDVNLNLLEKLDLKFGFWVIEPSGILTIIVSKRMFVPWLTRGFIAAGKFENKGSSLHFFPCNKFSAACDILKFIKPGNYSIHLNKFNLMKKSTKKIRRPIKKKNYIIQDERQRDNLPSLLTLLSGN